MRRLLPIAYMLAAFACVNALEDPSNVRDLRVLGVRMDPPELMANACPWGDAGLSQVGVLDLSYFAQDVTMTALVADPDGGGRSIDYDVHACANPGDKICGDAGYSVLLGKGTAPSGEVSIVLPKLALTTLPGRSLPPLLPDGGVDTSQGLSPFLLAEAANEDTLKGLGGVQLPVVLHVRAGAEEIYAQKLMVFSYHCFAGQTPQQNPELPGLNIQGEPWFDGAPYTLAGFGSYWVTPDDFTSFEAKYLVPTVDETPIELQESWVVSWYTDLGVFGPQQTGGSDLGGQVSKQLTHWLPPAGAPARDVHFWAVVRNGRGGLSWLTRTAHYNPIP